MDWFINGALFGLGWTLVSCIPTAVGIGWMVWCDRRQPEWRDDPVRES